MYSSCCEKKNWPAKFLYANHLSAPTWPKWFNIFWNLFLSEYLKKKGFWGLLSTWRPLFTFLWKKGFLCVYYIPVRFISSVHTLCPTYFRLDGAYCSAAKHALLYLPLGEPSAPTDGSTPLVGSAKVTEAALYGTWARGNVIIQDTLRTRSAKYTIS